MTTLKDIADMLSADPFDTAQLGERPIEALLVEAAQALREQAHKVTQCRLNKMALVGEILNLCTKLAALDKLEQES